MSCGPWFRRCDIKYCKTESGKRPEVHPTPREPHLFKKWEEAVKCTGTRLRRNGRVCEKHFDSRDIAEFGCLKKEREGSSGSDLIVTENIKMRVLVHGAVPKKFEDEIAEYLKQKELKNVDSDSEIIIDADENLSPEKQTHQHSKRFKQNDNNNATVTKENSQAVEKSLKSAEELLFEKVYTGKIEPRLPNKSWNVHNCQIPEKGIVFAELAELSTDHSIPPLFRKSVYFDGNFNMRIYFVGKLFPSVEFSRPKSIRDLEELLRHINAFKVCEGGPSDLINCNFAHKDEQINKWRHNDCELYLKRGRICKYCAELCTHANRLKSIKK